MGKITFLIKILFVFFISLNLSADPYSQLPGAIPLSNSLAPAGDLSYQGRPISSKEAARLERQEGLDTSTLDPYPSAAWNPEFSKGSYFTNHDHLKDDILDDMGLSESGEQFEFIDFIPSLLGTIMISVRSTKTDENYIVVFGPQSHNILMRKALLRKLGYQIAPIGYLKNYSIKFRSGYSVGRFINDKNGDIDFNDDKAIEELFLYPSIQFQTRGAPDQWATNISKETIESAEAASEKLNPECPEDAVPVSNDHVAWVINNPEDEKNSLVRLQDAVIFKSTKSIFPIADGFVNTVMTRGNRRTYNATHVPLALVQMNESVNLFPWEIGVVTNGRLELDFQPAEGFNTSVEDFIWISKRILKLTRQDFIEIAAQSHLPTEVTSLLVEKLISRRNSLREILKFENGSKVPEHYKTLYQNTEDLPFDSEISGGDYLKKGKVTQIKWEGYGSRFSFGEPDAIFSSEEIFAFGKSKILSNVVSNVMSEINTLVFPSVTDKIAKVAIDKQIDIAVDNFVHFLKTGEKRKVPLGYYQVPYATGSFIVSREIVTGSFLGTDNIVQLADTVGIAGRAGVFVGTHGLPTSMFASGRVEGRLVRKYIRLKPLKSMKRALSVPFTNPVIPLLIRGELPEIFNEFIKTKEKLDQPEHADSDDPVSVKEPIINVENLDSQSKCHISDVDNDSESEVSLEQTKLLKLQQAVTQTMKAFTDELEVGESLLITDSIEADAGVTAGYSFTERLKVQIDLGLKGALLARLHILRSDENTLQIYDDFGNKVSFQAAAGLQTGGLPLLKFDSRWTTGSATTKFYSLNIDPRLKINSDIISNMYLINDIVFSKNLRTLEASRNPLTIEHDFDQSSFGFRFLIWKHNGLETTDNIKVVSRKGYEHDYVTATEGIRSGIDYQTQAIEIINELINEYTESVVEIASSGSGDPGDTIFGQSHYRKVRFDARVRANSPYRSTLDNEFAHVQYRWKGWEIDRKGALKITKKINTIAGTTLIPDSTFNDTKEVQLYRFDLNIYLYNEAIDHLMSLDKNTVYDLFLKHGKIVGTLTWGDDSNYEAAKEEYLLNKALKFIDLQSEYREEQEEGDSKEAAQEGAELVSLVQNHFDVENLVKFVGGKENIYLRPELNGFRVGDDNGDRVVFANSFGRYGSIDRNGPIQNIISQESMSSSEFFVSWLLERL